MPNSDKDWEIRKIRKNGKRFEVTVPKWWAMDASTVFNAHIVFSKKDGMISIRLILPDGTMI